MTGNQLDVIIDKKPIRALVDSGASFSVISDKYRRFLKKVLFADAKSVMLKVADGNFVRPIGKCVLRVRINNRELPFEFIVLSHCSHDVILGWDFLEASQAVIDCGQNELVLEDICRDSTAPDAWNLYATRDYTLKPHSLTRITVSGYQTRGDINVVLDGSKHLLFEKNIATPSMVSTYRNGKSDVWVTNLQFETKSSLEELTNRETSYRTTPEIFWAFHEDRQVDSRKDECETQDFTGDHAPINQRAYRVSPTERRIIHEEVQKMLDEGIVQPSESPWSSPIVLEAGLKLNSKKCLFAAQVKILGHLVSSNGVRPDPDKIKAVRNFPTQKNIHDIRSFLGLCSYFRRFIKGFCYLAEPLQSLLKSGVEFHWGPEEVEAFNSLKKALTSDPVLGMYDERASTEIHTDASGYGIGAVLVQIQNNVEKVIAYASRTLTKAEKNYSTTEGNVLPSYGLPTNFGRTYSENTFTVVTDHHSLCWLMNLKDPSGRLARWALRLQEHDFDVKYKTGKKHSDADALSRNPVEEETETSDKFLAVTTDTQEFLLAGNVPKCRSVCHALSGVPKGKSVPQRPPGRLVPIPPAIAPFHRIGIDLLGRFPKSAHGNKWIIVCTDYSTRYAITKALPTAEVDEIAKFLLEEIVLRHGAPRVIITDRGAVFRSRLVSSLVDLCNIDHRFTTAYHPQTNGLTERFNKTLADMLSISQSRRITTASPSAHSEEAQDKNRRRYDSKHQMVSYAPGDLVWVYTPVRKVGLSEKLLEGISDRISATPFISRDLRSTRF
ncbi:retrovirus-related Pol polyprotein from transposon 17.6 [Trichonephila clavipes]|nr:retrovirus-related Pol polyprotein from transposon 17.6 [Trichonephila clavipes]